MIVIVDCGSQYTLLIARRIRQLEVAAEIFPPEFDLQKLENLEGIVLSGGPSSVYDKGSPKLSDSILSLKVPVLGICYGLQILAKNLGGEVVAGKNREYGKESVNVKNSSPLFKGLASRQTVWLSHGDKVAKLP